MHKVMFPFEPKSDHFLNTNDFNELRENVMYCGEHYISVLKPSSAVSIRLKLVDFGAVLMKCLN